MVASLEGEWIDSLPAPAIGLVAGLVAGLQPAWLASRTTPGDSASSRMTF